MRKPSIIFCLAACVVSGSLFASPIEHGPKPRLVDALGDDLPEGAITRIGSIRYRHPGLKSLAILNGGEKVLSVGDDLMARFWEIDTGKQIESFPLPKEFDYPCKLRLSPSGKRLAIVSNDALRIWNVATKLIEKKIEIDASYLDDFKWSPSESEIALGCLSSRVVLCDVNSGKIRQIQLCKIPKMEIHSIKRSLRLAYSANSKVLAVCGIEKEGAEVAIIDLTSDQIVFSANQSAGSVCLNKLGDVIAVRRPDFLGDSSSTIAIYDVPSILPKQRIYAESDCAGMVFSNDDSSLACVSRGFGGLFDLKTGKRLFELPSGDDVVFSDDNRKIVCHDSLQFRVFDLVNNRYSHSCKQSSGDHHFELSTAAKNKFSLDSKFVTNFDLDEGVIQIWDVCCGKIIRKIPTPRSEIYPIEIAFSTDSKTISILDIDRVVEHLKVTATPKPPMRPSKIQKSMNLDGCVLLPNSEHLSPDGKLLAIIREKSGVGRSKIQIRDTITEKVVGEFDLNKDQLDRVSWTPTGRSLVIEGNDGIHFFDAELKLRKPVFETETTLVISEDDLLMANFEFDQEWPNISRINVWEINSATKIGSREVADCEKNGVVISSSMRVVAFVDKEFLRVLDLTNGQELAKWKLPKFGNGSRHEFPVSQLMLSPNGKLVAGTLSDGTILIWDLSTVRKTVSKTISSRSMEELWKRMANEQSQIAVGAMWELLELEPSELIRFLSTRVHPVNEINSDVLTKLFAELGSDDVTTREKAFATIANFGVNVLTSLRTELGKSKSSTLDTQLRNLIARSTTMSPSTDTLRTLRSIRLLESLPHQKESRELIEIMSRGAADAAETRAAKAALIRIKRENLN